MEKRQRFTAEFKREAIRLMQTSMQTSGSGSLTTVLIATGWSMRRPDAGEGET
ncbi:MAG: hypothetical protein ABI870_12890 [Rhodanobacter sp.]